MCGRPYEPAIGAEELRSRSMGLAIDSEEGSLDSMELSVTSCTDLPMTLAKQLAEASF